jgi:glutamate synthase (NADPH/NADH) large chain
MSGGIAFVHDPEGDFPSRVNFDMVSFAELDDDDLEFLHHIVRRHHDETGSAAAEDLLGDWDSELRNFRKVMPNDYQRVLDATRRAEAEGRDVIDAVMEASRG